VLEPKAGPWPVPQADVVQWVGGWFDKQHPQAGVAFQEAGYEELVATPHLIPWFKRANHQVTM
jgi:hypothetical protein